MEFFSYSYDIYKKFTTIEPIKNFQFLQFDDEESSIGQIVTLSRIGIHSLLVPHNFSFFVCWEGKPYRKSNFIEEKIFYSNMIKSKIPKADIDRLSFREMVNFYFFDNQIIFEKNDNFFENEKKNSIRIF